ncbi:MAG: PIN domain-containing protein [Gemmatimonadota bacterium]
MLDTSIVSAPVAKTPNPFIVRRLEERGHQCAIGAPVWHELAYGVRRLPRGRRRTTLESYLNDVVKVSFPILPSDDTSALWHGHERARLEALGRRTLFVDGQIAAIAHSHKLVLVTLNAKDFLPFAGLKVENWSE